MNVEHLYKVSQNYSPMELELYLPVAMNAFFFFFFFKYLQEIMRFYFYSLFGR